MYYNYRTKDGKIIKCWFNDIARNEKENIFGTMEISKSNNKDICIDFHQKDEIKYIIYDLENPYFIFNNEKIFFKDFICRNPKEFVSCIEMIRDGKEDNNISGDELCQILIKYGMDSLKISMLQKEMDIIKTPYFNIGFSSRSNTDRPEDFKWIDYGFESDWLTDPRKAYKLLLAPIDKEDRFKYPKESFYVTDLISMLRNKDNNYMILKVNDKKEQK